MYSISQNYKHHFSIVTLVYTLDVFFSVQHVGTISFGEFSAILEQSDAVPRAESRSTEAVGVDISDASFTKSPPHSVIAG